MAMGGLFDWLAYLNFIIHTIPILFQIYYSSLVHQRMEICIKKDSNFSEPMANANYWLDVDGYKFSVLNLN